jgi:hypothetical protein
VTVSLHAAERDAKMLKDFNESPCMVLEDGTLKPPIAVPVYNPVTWAADPDGIVATACSINFDGEPCLLSVLFPMDAAVAVEKVKRKEFPERWTDGCYVNLTRKAGDATGQSGETYSRFIGTTL